MYRIETLSVSSSAQVTCNNVHHFDWLCGEADTYIKPLATCCNQFGTCVKFVCSSEATLKLNSGGSDFAVYQTVALRCTQQQGSDPIHPTVR